MKKKIAKAQKNEAPRLERKGMRVKTDIRAGAHEIQMVKGSVLDP